MHNKENENNDFWNHEAFACLHQELKKFDIKKVNLQNGDLGICLEYIYWTYSKESVKNAINRNKESLLSISTSVFQLCSLNGYSFIEAKRFLREEGIPQSIISEASLLDQSNWSESALIFVRNSLHNGVSPSELRRELRENGFTTDEIHYALDYIDYTKQAKIRLVNWISKQDYTGQLKRILRDSGFKNPEINNAINQLPEITEAFTQIKSIAEQISRNIEEN